MTKSESREAAKLMQSAKLGMIDYAARGMSSLIRATRKSRNELITIAAGIPAVVQHREFIISNYRKPI